MITYKDNSLSDEEIELLVQKGKELIKGTKPNGYSWYEKIYNLYVERKTITNFDINSTNDIPSFVSEFNNETSLKEYYNFRNKKQVSAATLAHTLIGVDFYTENKYNLNPTAPENNIYNINIIFNEIGKSILFYLFNINPLVSLPEKLGTITLKIKTYNNTLTKLVPTIRWSNKKFSKDSKKHLLELYTIRLGNIYITKLIGKFKNYITYGSDHRDMKDVSLKIINNSRIGY